MTYNLVITIRHHSVIVNVIYASQSRTTASERLAAVPSALRSRW